MADQDNKKGKKKAVVLSPEEWAAFKRNDIPTEVNGLMRNAYLQYSVSANIGRAIPDVRDGLKPGARRILYAMLKGGYGYSGTTNKSAKVVGLVIGNYHPHGDTAVYDTMVHMAQPFSMRLPLIFPKGNFGSIDGDEAAAYRYSECKMQRAAEALLKDLEMDTVDMRDTFDAKEKEPTVLPAAFPNLLVNGSQGIGVGMATNIPPHNLGEVIDGTVAVIDNPNITIPELMQYIPGPDYPTGGIIHGTAGIKKLYETGMGVIHVRGKVEVETDEHGKDLLVITEIPFGLYKADMVARIGELIKNGVIHGISDINDYSDVENGIRIEIELKQDAAVNVVINELYKLSPLESTNSCQMLCVDHNRPRTMNLKQILDAYIDHREQVIRRRTQFLLNKAQARLHIVDGLLIAQAHIDEVIQIIKQSKDSKDAQAQLIARFQLDELQTAAILAMRLSQLTNLGLDELNQEKASLEEEINRYLYILASREHVMEVVRKELLETKEKFADARRTRIEAATGADNLDGLTKREIYMVTLTKGGYIKRCNADEYESQNRGGSGVKGITARKEGDSVQMVLSTRSHNCLLFFTNFGKVYRLNRAYELPESGRADAGRFISNVLQFAPHPDHPEIQEEIRAIISYDEYSVDFENTYVVMVTKRGVIKRCKLELFKRIMRNGKRALTFRDDDDLIDAQFTNGSQDILLSSRNGQAVRFNENQVRSMGTSAAGVRGILLKPDSDGVLRDSVVSMTIVAPEDKLLVLTAHGLGKMTPIGLGTVAGEAPAPAPVSDEENETEENLQDTLPAETEEPAAAEEPAEAEIADEENEAAGENEDSAEKSSHRYRLTKRGTKGVTNIKLREKDYVVAALRIAPNQDEDILLISSKGQTVRTPVNQIRICGRSSFGVIVMRMAKENDEVVNVSLVPRLSEADAAANSAAEDQAAQNEADAKAFQEARRNAEETNEPDANEPETEQETGSGETAVPPADVPAAADQPEQETGSGENAVPPAADGMPDLSGNAPAPNNGESL